MPSKSGKITAGKARERIESLEESIASRRHRLDQLQARLERSDVPDERLVTAKTRLERRIEQEEEQLEKLLRLLDRQEDATPDESSDFEAEEELDDLHRSFEEIRQNVAQMQLRIDGHPEVPRDLEARLTACESRLTRRETADTEIFARVMSMQTALDQERQAGRKLMRRFKEQEQKLDDLGESVEDAVVTTVDLAGRIEELAELSAPVDEPGPPPWANDLEELRQEAVRLQADYDALNQRLTESLAQASVDRQAIREHHQVSESSLLQQLAQLEPSAVLVESAEATAQNVATLREQIETLLVSERRLDASLQETVPRLDQLQSRLAALESRSAAETPTFNPELLDSLTQRVAQLEAQIQLEAQSKFPFAEILSRLAALESAPPTESIEPLAARLSALEQRPPESPSRDRSFGLESRVSRLETLCKQQQKIDQKPAHFQASKEPNRGQIATFTNGPARTSL